MLCLEADLLLLPGSMSAYKQNLADCLVIPTISVETNLNSYIQEFRLIN